MGKENQKIIFVAIFYLRIKKSQQNPNFKSTFPYQVNITPNDL